MRFKKPKPIYRRPALTPASPQAAPAQDLLLLTANMVCLTTEDKNKFVALYRDYLDEYHPQGQTQRDLVEEMVVARWRQRRCAIIETGILNVTMDRMAEKIDKEFAAIPHAIRTALAYIDQHGQDGALARIARDEARHVRAFHRALRLLRELQAERAAQHNRDREGAYTPPPAQNRDREGAEFLPNEPKPRLTPIIPIVPEPPRNPDSGPEHS